MLTLMLMLTLFSLAGSVLRGCLLCGLRVMLTPNQEKITKTNGFEWVWTAVVSDTYINRTGLLIRGRPLSLVLVLVYGRGSLQTQCSVAKAFAAPESCLGALISISLPEWMGPKKARLSEFH